MTSDAVGIRIVRALPGQVSVETPSMGLGFPSCTRASLPSSGIMNSHQAVAQALALCARPAAGDGVMQLHLHPQESGGMWAWVGIVFQQASVAFDAVDGTPIVEGCRQAAG